MSIFILYFVVRSLPLIKAVVAQYCGDVSSQWMDMDAVEKAGEGNKPNSVPAWQGAIIHLGG